MQTKFSVFISQSVFTASSAHALQLGFCRLRVQCMISRSGVKLCSDLCDGEFVVIFDL